MAAKKSFKNDNPAMRFISPVEISGQTDSSEDQKSAVPTPDAFSRGTAPVAEEAGAPMKRNPLYIETRSRRLNLLIQPTLHKRIKKLAENKNTSVNDLIHIILEEYADKEEK